MTERDHKNQISGGETTETVEPEFTDTVTDISKIKGETSNDKNNETDNIVVVKFHKQIASPKGIKIQPV